ncbi:MAG: hypothetical protein VR78_06145 [Hoeflea sp. BRH_c9]|nr:MAG: hypothetical protein VR78_06145 [Hoeflea sp. BRH_c9]
MADQGYTFALILMWAATLVAAYFSRYLPGIRGYRTACIFSPIVLFALLNWYGKLDIWPLSAPLPDLGRIANLIVYAGVVTGLAVFAMLRLVKHKTPESR